MVTVEQQEMLTRVGPETPMGQLMRRYWFAIAASSELQPRQAKPVRLLGEDLVLFRTEDGELGLLDRYCTHRRTTLEYGIIDNDGIRCPYHGWKFNRNGACTEIPSATSSPALLEKAATRAYRAQELGGLVFAYLGPEPAPLLPRYDLLVWDNCLRDVGMALLPCNWLQIMENSVDPKHVEWLHGQHLDEQRERSGRKRPKLYRRRHVEIGFDRFEHGIIKRRVLEGGSREDDDWKVGHPLVFPFTLRVGVAGQHRLQIRVPVDDTHTLHIWYACYRPPPGRTAPRQETVPVYTVPWQDESGRPIADFIDGGDVMTWVGQGPITDRTRELLVDSDKGILLYRKMLFDQMAKVAAGEDPVGIVRDPERNRCIDLPQEEEKYGHGHAFLAEAIELSHVRYSPIREQIINLFAD
jgi:5,5'-dehydrodivanillate O-demethylase